MRWRGVARDAVQQGQLGAAGIARGVDGVLDLGQRGHAGGEDQRLPGADALADEVIPEQLVGGNLINVDIGLELGHGIEVEGRASEFNAAMVAALGEFRQKGRRQFPVLAFSVRFALGQDLGREQLVDLEQLELDRVATNTACGVDEFEAAIEVAMVVAGNFGNELGGHEDYQGSEPTRGGCWAARRAPSS